MKKNEENYIDVNTILSLLLMKLSNLSYKETKNYIKRKTKA